MAPATGDAYHDRAEREPRQSGRTSCIADVRRQFDSFFRWIAFLDDMIKKDIGPKFGVDVSLRASAVEQKAMGLLYVSRPLKEPLAIPVRDRRPDHPARP